MFSILTLQLQKHREATFGLDERYTDLVDCVLFKENARPRRAMRRYHAEYAYMMYPDVAQRFVP